MATSLNKLVIWIKSHPMEQYSMVALPTSIQVNTKMLENVDKQHMLGR